MSTSPSFLNFLSTHNQKKRWAINKISITIFLNKNKENENIEQLEFLRLKLDDCHVLSLSMSLREKHMQITALITHLTGNATPAASWLPCKEHVVCVFGKGCLNHFLAIFYDYNFINPSLSYKKSTFQKGGCRAHAVPLAYSGAQRQGIWSSRTEGPGYLGTI